VAFSKPAAHKTTAHAKRAVQDRAITEKKELKEFEFTSEAGLSHFWQRAILEDNRGHGHFQRWLNRA
jgi:hypothetical protein